MRPFWTAQEAALLGKVPDGKVTRRIGRTLSGVRNMPHKLAMARLLDRRPKR
jgi:hypothetical protein